MKKQNLKSDFFKRNRQRFSTLIGSDALAVVFSNPAALRTADQYYIYRQNSDLLYLTGINQSETILVYDSLHGHEVLFITKPDPKRELWDGKLLRIDEAQDISGIDDVRYSDDFQTFIDNAVVHVEHLRSSGSPVDDFAKGVVNYLLKTKPSLQYANLNTEMAQLRVVKSPEELQLIKQSVAITSKAFLALLKLVKPGNFEYQVEAEIIRTFIAHGADGHAFDPIVASGENACTLHYIRNNCQMKPGQLLLLDFGCECNGYAADMSRTLPVAGKFSVRQRAVYQAVLDAQKLAIEHIKPGITIKDINKLTGSFLEQRMIDLGLFTSDNITEQDADNPLYKKYFPHGTSHFMGIDVHDVGMTDKPLEPGMVITCEPGIYIPQEQIGVRIENDILITDQGCEDLMQHVPREIIEIERLMGG